MSTNAMPGTTGARSASILNVIAGLWLIISPFILRYNVLPAALWDTLIVGIIVLIFSFIRAVNPERNIALSWLNLLLGIWLLISPFVLTYSGLPSPTWNEVVLGIIVIILSFCSAVATPESRQLVRR